MVRGLQCGASQLRLFVCLLALSLYIGTLVSFPDLLALLVCDLLIFVDKVGLRLLEHRLIMPSFAEASDSNPSASERTAANVAIFEVLQDANSGLKGHAHAYGTGPNYFLTWTLLSLSTRSTHYLTTQSTFSRKA